MNLLQHTGDLAICLLLLLGPLPLCIWLLKWAQSITTPQRLAYRLLAISVLWCGLQTALVIVLGAGALYRLPMILLAELAVFTAGAVVWRRTSSGPILIDVREQLSPAAALTRHEKVVLASAVLIGLILLVKTTTRPIIDFDSLWYHLPSMVLWYQNGSLAMMEPTGEPVFDVVLHYPYNWEALSSLFFFPFREDLLAAFPKLISWGMFGLSVLTLSMRLGASRLHAGMAAALALSVPFLLFDINTLRIEVPFAAFVCCCVTFGYIWLVDRSPLTFLLLITSCGMLAGMKVSGLVYVIMILVVVGPLWLLRRRRRRPADRPRGIGVRPYAGLMLGALLLGGITGGYWYLRNLAELGNPVGMVQVQIGDLVLFPGEVTADMIQGTSLASLFDLANPAHWRQLGIQAVVRLQLPFIALALMALFLPRALFSARFSRHRAELVGLVILLACTAWLYWHHYGTGGWGFSSWHVSPFLGQAMRYGFPLIGLVAIAAAVSATSMRLGNSAAVSMVVICSLAGLVGWLTSEAIKETAFKRVDAIWASGVAQDLARRPVEALRLLASALAGDLASVTAAVACYLAGIGLIWKSSTKRIRIRGPASPAPRAAVAVALALLVIMTTWGLRTHRDARRKEFYGEICHYIIENTLPDEKIGFAYSNRRYLYYGRDLNRTAIHVPGRTDDIDAWLADLRKRDIAVVGIGPTPRKGMSPEEIGAVREVAWLESAGGIFEKVFGEDLVESPLLYRWSPSSDNPGSDAGGQ